MNTKTELSKRNIEAGLISLKNQHKTNFTAWLEKLSSALKSFGADFEESLQDFDISAEDFEKCGYSPDEAAALIFILSEDDNFGMAVNSGAMIDRYLTYTAK